MMDRPRPCAIAGADTGGCLGIAGLMGWYVLFTRPLAAIGAAMVTARGQL